MFSIRNIIVVLSAVCLAACSGGGESPAGASGTNPAGPHTRVNFQTVAGAQDVEVMVFRSRTDGSFLYDRTVAGAWTENSANSYQTSQDLYLGHYKFIFVKGLGGSLNAAPSPVRNATAYEQVKFVLAGPDQATGYYGSADELFLGRSGENQGEVYDLSGPVIAGPVLIEDTLFRAVGRLDLELLRGTIENGVGVSEPFDHPESDNILWNIDSVQMLITGPGRELYWDGNMIGGDSGHTVFHTFRSEDGVIDPENGFASISGPFLLPAGTTLDVSLQITLFFKPNPLGEVSSAQVVLNGGQISANKLTNVRIYIPDDRMLIYANASLAEMEQEIDGDTGLWN